MNQDLGNVMTASGNKEPHARQTPWLLCLLDQALNHGKASHGKSHTVAGLTTKMLDNSHSKTCCLCQIFHREFVFGTAVFSQSSDAAKSHNHIFVTEMAVVLECRLLIV